MKVVLIGFSGTGKSTVGRALASRLGWEFVDTDREVVRAAGKPIHRIFAEDGEPAFRWLEGEAVRRAMQGDQRIVALGGGAVMDPANRQALDGATVTLLDADPGTLLARLSQDMDSEPRPMLATADPQHRIESLKAAREPVYRELADVVVSTNGLTVEAVVDRIVESIEEHPAKREGAIRIEVQAGGGSYPVLLGRGLLDRAGLLLRESGLHGRVRLIADADVLAIYGPQLEAALRGEGFESESRGVPSGEASKSLEIASSLYDWLVETGTERRDLVLALGGGVVGDLAGFVAATFLRGLRLVQLPTSLLAQVDSSVGGKVAVNHPRGKNLIGAFYPPALVIADTATLSTLPRREASAMAEVVKHGVILDEGLFSDIEAQSDALASLEAGALEPIVARSIQIKARVVEQDEREAGLRAILNYGHTIGHAVETVTDLSVYRHGEAVAIGMAGAAAIAVELGMTGDEVERRQKELLVRLNLPVACPGLSIGKLVAAMGRDKKASEGKVAWVLPERIGRVVTRRDVPRAVVERVLERLTAG